MTHCPDAASGYMRAWCEETNSSSNTTVFDAERPMVIASPLRGMDEPANGPSIITSSAGSLPEAVGRGEETFDRCGSAMALAVAEDA